MLIEDDQMEEAESSKTVQNLLTKGSQHKNHIIMDVL